MCGQCIHHERYSLLCRMQGKEESRIKESSSKEIIIVINLNIYILLDELIKFVISDFMLGFTRIPVSTFRIQFTSRIVTAPSRQHSLATLKLSLSFIMQIIPLLLTCFMVSSTSSYQRSRWTMSKTSTSRPHSVPRLLATWTSIAALSLSPGGSPSIQHGI